MRTVLRVTGLLLGLLSLGVPLAAQLVAPPQIDWVSLPSSATVGSTVNVGAGAHANPSDNSDGNDWNTPVMLVVAFIKIELQRPGEGWVTLVDWLDPWRTPADNWASFTVQTGGAHYIRIQAMDGRPWFTDQLVYAIDVPNPAPAITSQLTRTVNQGQSVSYTITATNSPTSFGASGLPAGLSVNTSNGVISGTIPANGGVQGTTTTINSSISATNSAGTDNKTLVWTRVAAAINPAGSASPATIALGQSVTLTRAGTTNFGLGWTENVMWRPDGSPQVLGNAQIGSQNFTPGAVGTHTYQFRVVDVHSNYRDQWITFTVVALPAPTGLASSSVQTFSLNLSWGAVSGATGYKVYRNGTLIASPTGATFNDSGLSAGTTYSYTVRATNASGDSAVSAVLNVTTAAPLVVFTPIN
jgi:hypothetical protein